MMDGVAAGMSLAESVEAKEIVKEGLSEYFIYTIEGEETVPNGWSKRLRLFDSLAVPFDTVYRYRPAEYGDQLVRLFILTNDEESGLGSTPLPDGDVRLFRENGNDGLSYLVQHHTKYVPIGQKIELNLGRDREVIHEWIKMDHHRDNFWFREGSSRRYYSPDQGQTIKPNYTVAGWDEHEQWVERIRNYRDEPIKVEIRRSFYGHVIFTSELDPKLYDYQSPSSR